MTVNYTTLLALGQPVTGTESGTWGDDVNNAITSYLDIAIAGTLTLTSANFTAGALTIANTQGTSSATGIVNSGTSGISAQYAVIRVSSLAVNSTITAPSSSRIYLIDNADATYTVTIKASGQTGYTVAKGTKAWVYYNGTDYVLADTNDLLKLTGAFTSGGIPYFSSASAVASSGVLAANALVIGGGAGAAPATTTTGTGVVTAIGNNVNTTGGLVTQSGTLAASALLLGGGSGTAISSTTTGTGVVTALGNNTNAASGLPVLNASGYVAVAQGGTNTNATPTSGAVAYGTGTAYAFTAAGTAGQVLTSNGAGVPTWSNAAAGTVTSVSAGTGMSFSTITTSGSVAIDTTVVPRFASAGTFTATQTFSGSSSTLGAVLTDTAEVATVSATAATGTIAYDVTTQSVLYYTSNASANWTVNFRGSSGTSLNTLMSTGQSLTVAFLVTQGSTAYYNNSVQIDGTTSGVTMRWLGGAPTAGNASGIDSYRYLIIKTGSATYTVLASVTQFKA